MFVPWPQLFDPIYQKENPHTTLKQLLALLYNVLYPCPCRYISWTFWLTSLIGFIQLLFSFFAQYLWSFGGNSDSLPLLHSLFTILLTNSNSYSLILVYSHADRPPSSTRFSTAAVPSSNISGVAPSMCIHWAGAYRRPPKQFSAGAIQASPSSPSEGAIVGEPLKLNFNLD